MKGAEELVVIYVTIPIEFAPKLARTLVSEGLAACVNILPKIRSIYCWDEEIQDDEEALLIIKSRASRFDELAKLIRREHPYEVPEIIALPVSAVQPDYRAWILESVADGTEDTDKDDARTTP